jgi:hypothetical protein
MSASVRSTPRSTVVGGLVGLGWAGGYRRSVNATTFPSGSR